MFRVRCLISVIIIALLTPCASQAASKEKGGAAQKSSNPTTFAPMDATNPLANLWNDPGFTRQLSGSYGFLADREPKLNTEEQLDYREKILPVLQEDQQKVIPLLESRVNADSNPLYDFLLGNIYFQNGNYTNAIKHLEQATAKHGDFLRAWKQLGLALVREGRFREAIQPLSKTISLGGADGKIFGFLGYCYLNTGQYVSAEAAYRQAMIHEPDTVDFKLGIVKCLVEMKQFDPALALLDETLQSHPDNEKLWTIQADVYRNAEQYDKAAVNYEILRRLDKATPENLATLGDLYMMRESPGLALAAYSESVEKDGWEKPERGLRAAEILAARGAWDETQTFIAKIRSVAGDKLSEDDAMKLLKLESKRALALGEGDEAIQVLERIIDKNPLDGEALLMAGDYYTRNGQIEKAEFRYDTASKIQGFEADAYVKQAQLLVKSSKYTQAVEVLKKAQRIKPRDNVQRYLDKVEELARTSHS